MHSCDTSSPSICRWGLANDLETNARCGEISHSVRQRNRWMDFVPSFARVFHSIPDNALHAMTIGQSILIGRLVFKFCIDRSVFVLIVHLATNQGDFLSGFWPCSFSATYVSCPFHCFYRLLLNASTWVSPRNSWVLVPMRNIKESNMFWVHWAQVCLQITMPSE